MGLYRYQAAAASGELVTGEMEAADQDSVIERLHAQGYIPIDARETRAGLLSWLRPKGSANRTAQPKNLIFLTQQLGMLIQAGLSLDRALEMVLSVVEGKTEQERVRAVLDRVRGGRTLADAMAAQNGFFPAYYIGMVRAAEASGSLDTTLRHLAELLERADAAREQVKSALIYPMLVLVTGAGSIAILFEFVIPRFRPLFDGAGTTLPLATQIVLGISDGVQNYGLFGLVALLLLGLLWRRHIGTPEGRRRWHHRLLKLPLFGGLVVKTEVSRFGRTLGTLLRNGVSPLSALLITQETISNLALRDALSRVVDSVKEGKGLAEPLLQTGIVPTLAVNLIRVGEETARLDDMLLKVADIYEQETKRGIDRLLALLVPAVTIGLGVVVALVIGSILTAILSVYDLAL
ncbi:MAG TPA: type II secretion system F family protein [Stellaceae bacterium]|jgi:general secretion pathway protein F|nr:type II secretion system F family protein [Stellaceae bacterium]